MWRLGEMVIEETLQVVEGTVVVVSVMGAPRTEMKAVWRGRDAPGLEKHNEREMRIK
jgi:hypothetical protein